MFAINLPNSALFTWKELQFPTRAEALAYARECFGADEQGRISLVSEFEEEEDGQD